MKRKRPATARDPSLWEIGPRMLEAMQHIQPAPAHVLEFGSGNGTDRLAEAGYTVHSVESNPKWVREASTTVAVAPVVAGWYADGVVAPFIRETIEAQPITFAIFDGPVGKTGRAGAIRHFDALISVPVWIFDDTNRREDWGVAKFAAAFTGRSTTSFKWRAKAFTVVR